MTTQKFFISNIQRQSDLHHEQVIVNRRPVDFVWIQGILVDLNPDSHELIIDDGTDTILVSAEDLYLGIESLKVGDYIMIQGIIIIGEDDFGKVVIIRARLLYNLNPSPMADINLETLWQYEVMEALNLFTQLSPV